MLCVGLPMMMSRVPMGVYYSKLEHIEQANYSVGLVRVIMIEKSFFITKKPQFIQ